MLKWPLHYVYFALAGFDIFLLIISANMSHQNLTTFSNSIRQNNAFTEEIAELEQLAFLASKTNAPGNDVFDSHNPRKERENLKNAFAEYEYKRANILGLLEKEANTQPIVKAMEESHDALRLMLEEAELIFTAFEEGREKFAGTRMATMDRKYAVLNAKLRALRETAVKKQREALTEENNRAKELFRYELFLGGIILALILVVGVYGHYLGRTLKNQSFVIENQENKILNTQKMSDLGAMTAAIIHEINNPLSIISAKAKQLERKLNENNQIDLEKKANLDSIIKMAERITVIIKGVKNLSHSGGDDTKMELVDFSALYQETMALVQAKLKTSDVLVRSGQLENVKLECRPVQVSQIIINLINNAVDAISKLEERWVQINFLVTPATLQILVTDSGKGITPETLEKLFIPFYTTKERGVGTGLGLSLCRKIAESHGGSLTYRSESPNTQFVLTLPLKQCQPLETAPQEVERKAA